MLQTLGVHNSHEIYLADGGEMGQLTRDFDWSNNVLGTPDKWSRNLLTTLSIIFNSKFPMFLYWGSEHIQFYNDAYRPSLGNNGKHPKALGQMAEDCWPEVWHIIKPHINQVMAGGEATFNENQLIPIYRNEKLEEVYWTFCHSRVIDIDGNIGGVLVTCTETTDQVKQKQKIDLALLDLAGRESRLINLIKQAPVAIGLLKSRDLIVETANDKILEFWGKTNKVIGQPLQIALPELEGQPFLQILDDVFTSGVAHANNGIKAMLENNGILTQYYFDLIYHPILTETGETESILVIATDLTAQVKAREAIEESSSQFRQMADSIIQMVWVTDANGMHEYFNSRWYDFTGSDFDTTKDEGWLSLFHPEDRERTLTKWNHSLKTGEHYEVEYRLKNVSGEYIWVLGRAAPFYNTEGNIIKWFGTCTNIQRQKILQEQKDDFISIASHELKTPVTTLKAYLQLLNKEIEHQPTKALDLIKRANKSIAKVENLIGDLLEASKFNHGQLHLKKSNFKLAELIHECCGHTNLEGKYKVCIVGNESLEICADKDRLGQVITNFIGNAIKYAPTSKEINIEIENQSDYIKVSVTDKGPGIPPDQIQHLFDRYYRADSTGAQYSGLGLGLYISAEIIKKHEGKIGVDSEFGKGSTFWFTIPVNEKA